MTSVAATPRVRLRLTERQHSQLRTFLLPPDGLEAVAILLCGRGGATDDELLLVHQILEVPYDDCIERSIGRVTWPTRILDGVLPRLSAGWAIVKIHSHPGGYDAFSEWDDAADRDLFPGLYSWANSDRPHLSAIFLPDGSIRARVIDSDGHSGSPATVVVVGDHIRVYSTDQDVEHGDARSARTSQAFGDATTSLLSRLSVGVVGCSGTGGWVVELLTRLGVANLVLVDPDRVEDVNLNRIIHSTVSDAVLHRLKVDVLSEAIERTGLQVRVEAYGSDVHDPAIVRRLSRCDVIFGCVDSVDARELLTRIATYYVLPYFDVGVRLIADGVGGIAHIVGSANYVHPDTPSLMERGLYSPKQLSEAGLRRSDPVAFADQVKAGYISGAAVARPAVASVNAFYSSLAVNDMLERIHSYRDEAAPLGVTISLSHLRLLEPSSLVLEPSLNRWTGRGDTRPLLGLPSLS